MENVQRPLLVTTGLVGDTEREVAPDHRAYDRLAYALREQDRWSHREHAAFWTALLPELPRRRGRRSNGELVSRAAAALLADGLTRAEVKKTLNVEFDTVRARDPDTLRRRPSFELGARLIREAQEGALGEALGRSTGRLWVPWEAYPRVWDDPDDELQEGHFNTLIEVDWQPPGLDVALAAEEELRRRWYQRRAAEGDGDLSE